MTGQTQPCLADKLASLECQSLLSDAMSDVARARRSADPRDARDFLEIAERRLAMAARRHEMAARDGADVLSVCRDIAAKIAEAWDSLPPKPVTIAVFSAGEFSPHLN